MHFPPSYRGCCFEAKWNVLEIDCGLSLGESQGPKWYHCAANRKLRRMHSLEFQFQKNVAFYPGHEEGVLNIGFRTKSTTQNQIGLLDYRTDSGGAIRLYFRYLDIVTTCTLIINCIIKTSTTWFFEPYETFWIVLSKTQHILKRLLMIYPTIPRDL